MKSPTTKALSKLSKKYHLELLMIFGSEAKGTTHQDSDLDLAFYAQKKVNETKLYEELCVLFHRADIDLINIFKTHNHLLRYEILHKGKILFENKRGMHDRLKWQSYFDYIDFQKYYRIRSRLLDDKLAEAVKA
ncbi:nucleotidyltransferase domain-containing protein [Candidatus Woesearchaeota archaeon]|nr:nucleotidyltransferase domain-containing protein [Candidatus Woesearchaeota archaeon]